MQHLVKHLDDLSLNGIIGLNRRLKSLKSKESAGPLVIGGRCATPGLPLSQNVNRQNPRSHVDELHAMGSLLVQLRQFGKMPPTFALARY